MYFPMRNFPDLVGRGRNRLTLPFFVPSKIVVSMLFNASSAVMYRPVALLLVLRFVSMSITFIPKLTVRDFA